MKRVILAILLSRVALLLVKFTPRQLTRHCGGDTLDVIFTSFIIEEAVIHEVATLLEFSEYDFGPHYYFEESIERQVLLKKYFFHPEYHENIFSIEKLFNNPICLVHMLDHSTIPYTGSILRTLRINLPRGHWFLTSESLIRRDLMLIAKSQLINMESLDLFNLCLLTASYQDLEWLFDLMADSMFPTLMSHFLDCLQEWSYHDPIYDLKRFLANHYFTKDLSEEEVALRYWVIRTIIVTNIVDFIPEHVWNYSVMKRGFEVWEAIEIIVYMSEDFHGITSWSISMVLLEKCQNERLADWTRLLIERAIPGKLPPLLSRPFLRKYREIAASFKEIPELYRPIETWSLTRRYSLWLRNGVIVSNDRLFLKRAHTKVFIIESAHRGELPINIWIYDEDMVVWIGEYIIQRVLCQLRSTRPTFSGSLVLVAWAYALIDGRKLDLTRQFKSGTPESWHDFLNSPESIPCNARATSVTIFRTLKFASFFTPVELRELIDSSYNH